MSYQGSAAYKLGPVAPERRHEQERPSFDVVEGGGLDARVREGVSTGYLALARNAVIAAAVLVALGLCRVGLSVATMELLESTTEIRTQISELEDDNAQLDITYSILASSSRITRIATQNLGMVLAEDRVTVTVDLSSDEADAAEEADGEAVSGAGETVSADAVS